MAEYLIVCDNQKWRIADVSINTDQEGDFTFVTVSRPLYDNPAFSNFMADIHHQYLILSTSFWQIGIGLSYRFAYNILDPTNPRSLTILERPVADTNLSFNVLYIYTFDQVIDPTLSFNAKVLSMQELVLPFPASPVTIPYQYLFVSTFDPSQGVDAADPSSTTAIESIFTSFKTGTVIELINYALWDLWVPYQASASTKRKIFGQGSHTFIVKTRVPTWPGNRPNANTDKSLPVPTVSGGTVWVGQTTEPTTVNLVGLNDTGDLVGADSWNPGEPPAFPASCLPEDPSYDPEQCAIDVQVILDDIQASQVYLINETDREQFVLRSETCKIEGFNYRRLQEQDIQEIPPFEFNGTVYTISSVVKVNDADSWIEFVDNYPTPDANGYVAYAYFAWRERDVTRLPRTPGNQATENGGQYLTFKIYGIKLDPIVGPTFNMPVLISDNPINTTIPIIEREQAETGEIGLIFNSFVVDGKYYIWHVSNNEGNLGTKPRVAIFDVSTFAKKQNPVANHIITHKYELHGDYVPNWYSYPAYSKNLNRLFYNGGYNFYSPAGAVLLLKTDEPFAENIILNPVLKHTSPSGVTWLEIIPGIIDDPEPPDEVGPPECTLNNPADEAICVPLNVVVDITITDTSNLEPDTGPSGIKSIAIMFTVGSANPLAVFTLGPANPAGTFASAYDDASVVIPIEFEPGKFNYQVQIAKDTPYAEGRLVLVEVVAFDNNDTPGGCQYSFTTTESVVPICENEDPAPDEIDVPVDKVIRVDLVDPDVPGDPDLNQSGVVRDPLDIQITIGVGAPVSIYDSGTDTFVTEYNGSTILSIAPRHGQRLALRHATPWPYSTLIAVDITFEDVCGNVGTCTWSFTTIDEPIDCETIDPICENKFPPDGAVNVPINSTFGVDMVDPPTGDPNIVQSGVVADSIAIDVQIGAGPVIRVFEHETPNTEHANSFLTTLFVRNGFRFTGIHNTSWPFNTVIQVTANFRDACLNEGTCIWSFTTVAEDEEPDPHPIPSDSCAGLINAKGQDEHVVYNPYERTLPTANRLPWTLPGGDVAGTLSDEDTDPPYLYVNNTSLTVGTEYKRLIPVAPAGDFQIQFDIFVESFQTQGDGASAIQFHLQDGYRSIGVAIGDKLDLVDSDGNKITGSPSTSLDTSRRHIVHLRKYSHRYFELTLDGELIATIPYIRAEIISFFSEKHVKWGVFPDTVQATFRLYYLQYSVNTPFASEVYVQRGMKKLESFVKIVDFLKSAVFKPTLREMQRAKEVLLGRETFFKSDAVSLETYTIRGDKLPTAENPAWTELGTSPVEIDRKEIRITTMFDEFHAFHRLIEANINFDISFSFNFRFEPGFFDNPLNYGGVVKVGKSSQLGSEVTVKDGTRKIQIGWIRDLDNASVGLAFITSEPPSVSTENSLVVTPINERLFTLDGKADIRYEIFKSADREVWLFVNGRIVDAVPYTSFPLLDPVEANGEIIFGTQVAPNTGHVTRWRELEVEVSINGSPVPDCDGAKFYPFPQKNSLLQRMQDNMLFPSFHESNSELYKLIATAYGTHRNRGTDLFTIELCRITRGTCLLTVDSTPAGWFLERSDILDRIWLDSSEFLDNTYIEWTHNNTAYSPEEIASIIRQFLAPMDLLGNEMTPTLLLTILGLERDPTVDIIQVATTEYLSTGDLVIIRKADNSTRETRFIVDVLTTQHFTVSSLPVDVYGEDDYVRKPYYL